MKIFRKLYYVCTDKMHKCTRFSDGNISLPIVTNPINESLYKQDRKNYITTFTGIMYIVWRILLKNNLYPYNMKTFIHEMQRVLTQGNNFSCQECHGYTRASRMPWLYMTRCTRCIVTSDKTQNFCPTLTRKCK